MVGCCRGTGDQETEEKKHDDRFQRSKKILLLGTGESGKTTILKQMKILHINGFSERERKEKCAAIRQNIHESIHDIVYNMNRIQPPARLYRDENRSSMEYVLNLGVNEPSDYSEDYFKHVRQLWADEGVQEAFQRSNEYQLIESAAYFLDRIGEISRPDYIPTTQDILFCRVRTTSITEIQFSVPLPKIHGGSANFLMYDVGGQRGEQKKWIQVFDGIDAILFLIATSDFDLTLREDETKNRLEEALTVFRNIYCSRFVRDAALIVFLNKQDVLRRKIEQGRKIEKYFPQYSTFWPKGHDNEYDRAKLFMREKVTSISNTRVTTEYVAFIPGTRTHTMERVPPRDVYIHDTVATDTKNIEKVFQSVQEKILKSIIDTFKVY